MKSILHYLALDMETLGFNTPVLQEDGTYVPGSSYFPIVQIAGTLLNRDLTPQLSFDFMIQPTAAQMARAHPNTVDFHIRNGFDKEWENRIERLSLEQAEEAILETLNFYYANNHPECLVGGELPDYEYGNPFKIIIQGKSVGFDKSFLNAQVPKLALKLSHQSADTSAVRTMMYASKRLPNRLSHTAATHLALDDVNAAIADQRALVTFMEIVANALPVNEEFETLEDMTTYVSKNGLAYIAPKQSMREALDKACVNHSYE